MSRTKHLAFFSLVLVALTLSGCSRTPADVNPPTAEPTPEPVRYSNEDGGFSLVLPAGWDVDERSVASMGTEIRFGGEESNDSDLPGVLYYAPSATLDRDAILALLCEECDELPAATEFVLNNRPAWNVMIEANGAPARPWTIVDNGDALVTFSFVDPASMEPLTEVISSLRFTPVVDAEARTAEMAEAMRVAIAQQRDDDDAVVTISETEAVTWPDACLGAPLADEMCAQVATPGYRVTITSPAGDYVFHFDPATTQIRLAEAPEVEIGRTLVEWRSPASPCETALVGTDGVAFGACNSPVLLSTATASPARYELLLNLVATLAPFEAETPAGFVRFAGRGARDATPAEQRQLAEVARLLQVEAAGGSDLFQSTGAAVTWQRDGGYANYCDTLTLYLTGEVEVGSCREGGDPTVIADVLTLEELVQLYAWVDLFAAGELALGNDDGRGALHVAASLAGDGPQALGEADAAPLLTYAAGVFGARAAAAGLSPAPVELPADCPDETTDSSVLAVPELGLCLLYPATHLVEQPLPDQIVIAVDSLLNFVDPRVEITVEPAAGQTLDEIAAKAAERLDGEIAATTIAGEPARLVITAPDAELSREALLLSADTLYRLAFSAFGTDDDGADALDALTETVLGSFTLLE